MVLLEMHETSCISGLTHVHLLEKERPNNGPKCKCYRRSN